MTIEFYPPPVTGLHLAAALFVAAFGYVALTLLCDWLRG